MAVAPPGLSDSDYPESATASRERRRVSLAARSAVQMLESSLLDRFGCLEKKLDCVLRALGQVEIPCGEVVEEMAQRISRLETLEVCSTNTCVDSVLNEMIHQSVIPSVDNVLNKMVQEKCSLNLVDAHPEPETKLSPPRVASNCPEPELEFSPEKVTREVNHEPHEPNIVNSPEKVPNSFTQGKSITALHFDIYVDECKNDVGVQASQSYQRSRKGRCNGRAVQTDAPINHAQGDDEDAEKDNTVLQALEDYGTIATATPDTATGDQIKCVGDWRTLPQANWVAIQGKFKSNVDKFEVDDWVLVNNKLASVVRIGFGQYEGQIRVLWPSEPLGKWASGLWRPLAEVSTLRRPISFKITRDLLTGNEPPISLKCGSTGRLCNFDKEGDLIVTLDAHPGNHYIFLPDAIHLEFGA
jgi:hypothetical protein